MGLNFEAVGSEVGPFEQAYTWRDVALYALAVGAGPDDLGYVLEPAPKVLPTWGVIPAFEPVFAALEPVGANLVTLLHSAQRTELVKPFPSEGVMSTTATVEGIWDMKVGALVHIATRTSVAGALHAVTRWSLLLRGEGGFKGPRPPAQLRTRPPQGAQPAFRVEVPTTVSQALLYRLTGDLNPIHARPEVAREAGFERPILHGLCTYGIAARVALRELAGDDPARFKALEARFSKVVMPGDTLIVEGFPLEEPGQAALTVTIKESGEAAISHMRLEFSP